MKKIITMCVAIFMTISIFAQAPQKMSYLAVISNSSNALAVATPVSPTEATGATELLSSGTASENTPYWNGTSWVINNSNIHNNGAEVEIASTTQGFLPLHMTTAQRDAIASPAAGLTMYNTTVNCLQSWNGTIWDDYDGCGSTVLVATYAAGSVFCASGATTLVEVTNSGTGKIWMDRNLGASQVATSSTDANSYGDLYQWGRKSDGHQCRNSATTATLSSSDQPGHGNFILPSSSPNDWRSPQNTNLWQGVNGVNNPCPSLYRLPTETELDAERLSWSSNTSAGAFASPLKLPMAGERDDSSGSLDLVGIYGFYWGSTFSGTNSRWLVFNSSNAYMDTDVLRAYGSSVRCLKD
jgi:uncharacterized protein (TIGR02145 family)